MNRYVSGAIALALSAMLVPLVEAAGHLNITRE